MKPKKPIVRVREVMKSDLDIVDGMTTVSDAIQNMKFPETRTLIVDKRYDDDEYGVVWNDPDIAIDWPLRKPQVSEKDTRLPTLAEIRNRP